MIERTRRYEIRDPRTGTLVTVERMTRAGVDIGAEYLLHTGSAKHRVRIEAVSPAGEWLAVDVDSGEVRVVGHALRLSPLLKGDVEAEAPPAATTMPQDGPPPTPPEESHIAPGVDPSAVLEEGALIEAGAVVERGALVERGATVRQGAVVERGATVERGACIERDAVVGRGAVVERGATVAAGVVVGRGVIVARGSMWVGERGTSAMPPPADRACAGLTARTMTFAGRSLEDVALRAEQAGALVVDIRFNPFGLGNFQQATLVKRLGERYAWVKALGNAGHREGTLRIHDLEAGIAELTGLAQHTPVFLLCGCESAARCHRDALAAALRARGWDARELDEVGSAPRYTVRIIKSAGRRVAGDVRDSVFHPRRSVRRNRRS